MKRADGAIAHETARGDANSARALVEFYGQVARCCPPERKMVVNVEEGPTGEDEAALGLFYSADTTGALELLLSFFRE